MGAFKRFALLAAAIACLGGPLALSATPAGAAEPPKQASEAGSGELSSAKAEYQRLMDEARGARQSGDLNTAIARLQTALPLAEKYLGPGADETAETLSLLAHAYYDAGDSARAEPLYRRVLALKQKNFGKDAVETTVSLGALGLILIEQGKFDEAEQLLRRSLAIREKADGPDAPSTARSAGFLAQLLNRMGKYAESEKLFRRAIAALEKTGAEESGELTGYLNNFGVVLADQGRLDEAEQLYRRSLAIDEKLYGPDSPRIGAPLNNIADLEEKRGNLAEAEGLYRRVLAILEKAKGPDDPETANVVANLGYILGERGDFKGAEPLTRRALAIRTKTLGADHPDTILSFSNLAYALWQSGDVATAETMYRHVIGAEQRIYGPEHPLLAQDTANLASLSEEKGDAAEAERLFRQSTAIFEKVYGPDHPDVAQSLGNLGELLSQQMRLDEAEQLFRRELKIVERAYGPQSLQSARTYGHLAGVLVDRGKAGEASTLNARALAIMDKVLGPAHETTLSAANNLAYSLRREGKHEQALAYFRRTAAAGSPFVWAHLDSLWRAARSGDENPSNALVEGFAVVQTGFAGKAAAALNQLGARLAAGAGPLSALVRQEQDLVARERELDRSLLSEMSKPQEARRADTEAALSADLEKARADLSATREQLQQGFPRYADLEKPAGLDIREAQGLLRPDEALIVLDTEAGFVWAVTRETALWNRIAAKPGEIETQVAGLRGEIAGGMRGAQALQMHEAAREQGPQLAYSLYRELLAPVDGAIAGKDKLIFVLDGRTSSIPPAVLVASDPTGKDFRDVDWLVKRHAISVLPSVSSLKTLRSKPGPEAPKPFRGYGDPLLGREPPPATLVASRGFETYFRGASADLASLSAALAPLPETADEVRTVAKSLGAGDGDVVLGAAATETDVKRAPLSDYRIVYFATHGLVAGEVETATKSKAEPALVLSLPERPSDEDDGLLTASEIAGLKLNADWVVLSACNTAAGDKPGAEALSGLARAFFYAGARSLLVSHWPVESRSAVSLMTEVFSQVEGGADSADALRGAMLAVMNDPAHPAWAEPAYWAPFILVGDPAGSAARR